MTRYFLQLSVLQLSLKIPPFFFPTLPKVPRAKKKNLQLSRTLLIWQLSLADIHYQLEVHSCSNSVVIDSCLGLLVTRLNSCFLWEVQCHYWIRVTVSGCSGYINDYSTGSFLRDAKLYEIRAGTGEIRRLVLGRAFNKMFKE